MGTAGGVVTLGLPSDLLQGSVLAWLSPAPSADAVLPGSFAFRLVFLDSSLAGSKAVL